MSAFDFRDLLGGGSVRLGPDPALSDGVEKDQAAATLQAAQRAYEERMGKVVQFVAQTLSVNAHLNQVCVSAVVHAILVTLADAMLCQRGPGEHAHFADHIREALETIRKQNG
jgi:hypothetical protein